MDYKKAVEKIEVQLKEFIGNKKAVIGISGGIDSAVSAALCVGAVGNNNVKGILMPYDSQDMRDAKLVADSLEIKTEEANIKEIVGKFNFFETDKLSKGNIMARVRMTVLYAFANKLNGLVIGTGNKSEISIGYFTKYGDGGVDIEPIGDLYKTEVFEIAKILNIPKKIINKKPSAELWAGQTDEKEIGISYETLDKILQGNTANVNQETIDKINYMIQNSEHKRESPNILKIK